MKIGIVIPWFGRDLKGGAEQHAWQVAARLAHRGHSVEVLTTCCRSHQDDWATNHLPPGKTTEPEGFAIHRFPVDPRDRERFHQVCDRLLELPPASLQPGVSPATHEEADIFVNELIRSTDLKDFLIAQKTAFDAFILLPYLYGPVIHGVAAVADRACLQPCLHDEVYAYLPQVADAFYSAKILLFISEGEAELAAQLFGPAVKEKTILAGAGVELPSTQIRTRDSRSANTDRFVLYLGRKEPGKNSDMLVRAFTRFRRVRPNSKLRLVLAGHGRVESNGAAQWIDDRGLVSEPEKHTLLSECAALAQPSVNESFSRVMMEAWRYGKPVAVNRACLATATEVSRANGGWLVGSEDEWAAWFVEVDRASPENLARIGRNGREHANLIADWESVIGRYEDALLRLNAPTTQVLQFQVPPPAVNQFLPNLSPGDAISNQAIFIRDQLRELGFRSDIYVRTIHPLLPPNRCHLFSAAALQDSDAAIYHHSIGTDITRAMVEYAGPKCLVYHNITPAKFVEPYRPRFAELLRQGREDLSALAPAFDISYGDSQFNADELREAGFSHPKVLPIAVSPAKWSFAPDSAMMTSLGDGRTNIIFVGRIAPNKKQDDLIRAFAHYLAFDPDARLFLVGTVEGPDPYAEYLLSLIEHLGLKKSIRVTNTISDAALAAYYRTARLFWSMSEHEGFCVPLIEAMWFEVPVLAFRSSAIPETLGDAAIMFNDKSDSKTLAALARVLVTDEELRGQVIAAQRRQRRAFLPSQITPVIAELTGRLLMQESVHRLPAD
jgi:glycosyltransferase involved in cell wall biosynthesis